MTKKLVETSELFSIKNSKNNPTKLYVFGENFQQQGTDYPGGGQACIRGTENAFGFCTLNAIGDYWTDKKYVDNINQVEKDIKALHKMAEDFDTIVFPKYGLGTGRAFCQKNCPKTFVYICRRLIDEFGFNNIEFLQVPNF